MPTRFPNSLNLYTKEDSLGMAPTPWPNLAGWAVWHEDFEKFAGWTLLADSTGTAGWGSAAGSGQLPVMGSLDSVTAATDDDKNTLFPTPRVANTLAPAWPATTHATDEFIFATSFQLVTSLASGVAIGGATAATINSAGTAGNMTTAAPANGLYIRKVVTTAGNLDLILKRLATQSITLVAAASLALNTPYKVVAVIRNGTLSAYVNDVLVGTLTTTNMTTNIAPFIQSINGDTAGAEVAQTVRTDYLYYAWKSNTPTFVR